MNDCGTTNGFPLHDLRDDDDKVLMTLGERCVGRYPARDIINPANGEVIVHRNELVTDALGKAIDAAGIQEAYIRTNLTCAAPTGLCTKCYGLNLATNTVVEVGEAVGVIAAQ
jgi:DNA-directed RNA polymerase subunit beta'